MVAHYFAKLPIVVFAKAPKIVYVFGLKPFVILSGVTTGREFVTYVFFKLVKCRHC